MSKKIEITEENELLVHGVIHQMNHDINEHDFDALSELLILLIETSNENIEYLKGYLSDGILTKIEEKTLDKLW